ncbi:hypothetical protein HG530_009476 [Fusarium avenaceum]|nr:hypothetical protein HG530_009476 [Fusarium avenaceum]
MLNRISRTIDCLPTGGEMLRHTRHNGVRLGTQSISRDDNIGSALLAILKNKATNALFEVFPELNDLASPFDLNTHALRLSQECAIQLDTAMGIHRRKATSALEILRIIKHRRCRTPDTLAGLPIVRHGNIILVLLNLITHFRPVSEEQDSAGLDLDIVACPDGTWATVQDTNGVSFAPAFESAGYAT